MHLDLPTTSAAVAGLELTLRAEIEMSTAMTLRGESPKHACCGLTDAPSSIPDGSKYAVSSSEGPFCSSFPSPMRRVLGCPCRIGSRLVPSRLILNAVPKSASECEELEEISHVPSPCAAHLRILFSSLLPLIYFCLLLFSCSGFCAALLPSFNWLLSFSIPFFSSFSSLFLLKQRARPLDGNSGHASKQSDSLRHLLAPGRTRRTTTTELSSF